jgi:hypothetical protein
MFFCSDMNLILELLGTKYVSFHENSTLLDLPSTCRNRKFEDTPCNSLPYSH